MDDTNTKITDLEKRIGALEDSVRALRFAHLGGYRVLPARELTTPEKPIDFTSIGGKCVRKAPEADALKESVEKEDEGRVANGA